MQELRLEVLINLVQASDIRGTITHDQFRLLSSEDSQDCLEGFLSGDIALDNPNTVNGSHFLKVDTDHAKCLSCLSLLIRSI